MYTINFTAQDKGLGGNIGRFTRQEFDEYTKGREFDNGNYCFIDGSLYVFESGEWIFYSKAI